MGKIRVYYDSKGNTLNVWFDDSKKEFICDETGVFFEWLIMKQCKLI